MKDSRDSVISPSSFPSPDCLFTDVAQGLLRQGYGVRFCAKGWSMYPTIRDGEMITVEPAIPSRVKRGDILLRYNNRRVIAHRLVRIARRKTLLNPQTSIPGTFFILRGDALSACDESVDPGQVLGKVVSVERDGHLIDLDGWKSMISYISNLCIALFKSLIVRSIPWMKTY